MGREAGADLCPGTKSPPGLQLALCYAAASISRFCLASCLSFFDRRPLPFGGSQCIEAYHVTIAAPPGGIDPTALSLSVWTSIEVEATQRSVSWLLRHLLLANAFRRHLSQRKNLHRSWRSWLLLADQRGIEPPPAVCQRHKSAAIPTEPRGRLVCVDGAPWDLAIMSFGHLFALGVVMGMATPPLYSILWSSTVFYDLAQYWERDALSALLLF